MYIMPVPAYTCLYAYTCNAYKCTSVVLHLVSFRACFITERVISIWNKLPVPIVDSSSLVSFRRSLANIPDVEL